MDALNKLSDSDSDEDISFPKAEVEVATIIKDDSPLNKEA